MQMKFCFINNWRRSGS